MKIEIELTREDVKKLVLAELRNRLGNTELNIEAVEIFVKSKQNYKAEWEIAEFKATYISYGAI